MDRRLTGFSRMGSQTKYRCGVVTPIGPGHEALYRACEESVVTSFNAHPGLFSEVLLISVDDTEGFYGRSRSRNIGVQEALDQRADWVFFLDADDLMAPRAFELASPYLLTHDAVWGQIYCFDSADSRPVRRPDQAETLTDVLDLFAHDPFLSIQMGHFVRTRIAYRNPFEQTLNAGEDFDYYLRVWSRHRCTKISGPLFYNRRGAHSTGPRSATGSDWRMAVEERLHHYARQWGLPIHEHYREETAALAG